MQNKLLVQIKLIHPNFKKGIWTVPSYKSSGAAAFDLIAAIDETITVRPFQTEMISSGISIWVENPDYALIAMPRGGSGSKGLILGNTIKNGAQYAS